MLERIKLLLNKDDSADELLNTLISMCKEEAYIYCNLEKYDSKLDIVVSLLRSIYSFLISTLLLTILQFLATFAPILDTIFLEVTNKKRLHQLVKNALSIINKKLILFLILHFIFIITCWYYCTTFCIVYSSCQLSWVKSGITSLGISLFVAVSMCFVMSLLRNLGIKNKSVNLYNLSLFISKLY